MCLCIICFIKYIEENNLLKKKKKMEKNIFMALGLHLLTEIQLTFLIFIIANIEVIIILFILKRIYYINL
jgi:hypothetical protein